jgi:putative SOS response-associated peptidase YedK
MFRNADVRPTDAAPIIRFHDGQRLALPARWGLIPSWSKDDRIAQHTFNARAETLTGKPSFRAAFKRRRCIVPVSAFFEWRAVPGEQKKQKLRFTSPTQQPLALAGLWEHWQRPETGDMVETYTISPPPPMRSWRRSMTGCRSSSISVTGRPGSTPKREIPCSCSRCWSRVPMTGWSARRASDAR